MSEDGPHCSAPFGEFLARHLEIRGLDVQSAYGDAGQRKLPRVM